VYYYDKMLLPYSDRGQESSPKNVPCAIALFFGPLIAILFGAIGGYQTTLDFNFWIGLIPSCTVWLILLPLIFIFVRAWQISLPLFAALHKFLISGARPDMLRSIRPRRRRIHHKGPR